MKTFKRVVFSGLAAATLAGGALFAAPATSHAYDPYAPTAPYGDPNRPGTFHPVGGYYNYPQDQRCYETITRGRLVEVPCDSYRPGGWHISPWGGNRW